MTFLSPVLVLSSSCMKHLQLLCSGALTQHFINTFITLILLKCPSSLPAKLQAAQAWDCISSKEEDKRRGRRRRQGTSSFVCFLLSLAVFLSNGVLPQQRELVSASSYFQDSHTIFILVLYKSHQQPGRFHPQDSSSVP